MAFGFGIMWYAEQYNNSYKRSNDPWKLKWLKCKLCVSVRRAGQRARSPQAHEQAHTFDKKPASNLKNFVDDFSPSSLLYAAGVRANKRMSHRDEQQEKGGESESMGAGIWEQRILNKHIATFCQTLWSSTAWVLHVLFLRFWFWLAQNTYYAAAGVILLAFL